jgi:ribonuclease HI
MVPQRHKKKHINYKEMFAVLQALQLWLASFAGRQVHVYCDNNAVVAALRKQTIRGNAISPLRKIAMIAALHDVQLTAQDLPALLQ